jgi:hypothetical protein
MIYKHWEVVWEAIIRRRSLLLVYSIEQLGRLTRNIGTGALYRAEYTLHFKVLVPSTHTTKYLTPLLGAVQLLQYRDFSSYK